MLSRFVFQLLENNEWHDKADSFQFLIPLDNPAAFRDYLRRGVLSGSLLKADIIINDRISGMFVYSIDHAKTSELVALAAYCEQPHIDASFLLNDCAEKMARKHNCASIRLHTRRAGLVRKSLDLGFRLSEITLRRHIT